MITKILKRILTPQKSVLLGRWNLKNSNDLWQKYLNVDPGYQNLDKDQWIEKLKKNSKN